MNKDADKTKEQLLAKLEELQKKSKEQEDKLKAANQQLDAHNKQLHTIEQELRTMSLPTTKAEWKAQIETILRPRPKSEELTQKIETSLIYTLENMSDGFVSLDENWYYTYINKKAGEMFGRKPEDLIGKHIWTEFPEGIGQPFYKNYYKAVETKKEIQFEDYYQPWDRWFENRVFPSPKGLSIFFQDITERKLADEKLKATNLQLNASNQQLLATEQQLRANNQQLIASEKALMDSEEKFQKIIYESFAGIAVVNEEGKIIVWNNALERITGIKKTETIDRYAWEVQVDLLDNDTSETKRKEKIRSSLLTGLKTGKAQWLNKVMERAYIHHDGTVKIVSDSMYTIKTQKGYLVISVSNDITERKQAEKDLKESEEKYADLIENMTNAVAILQAVNNGEGFIIQDFNKAGEKIENIKREELIGKKITEMFPALKESGLIEVFQEVWKTGKPQYYPVSIYKDNRISSWQDNYVYKLSSGEIVVIYEDITESKQAEEALKESEETFKGIFNSTTDAIYVLDKDGIFLDINQGAINMYGYPREEIIGKTPEMVSAPGKNDLKMVNDCIQKANNGEAQQFEFWGMRKNGEVFLKIVRLSAGNYFGKKIILAFATDITEQKQAEKDVKESEERFKALHNASFGGITIHDKGIILECNLGLSKISGFSREELIGADSVDLLIAQESRKTVRNNIRSGYEKSYEVLGLRKNGEKYPVRLEARQIPYKGKNVRVVEFRDITEHKQKEEALRKSEAIKNTMVSNIGDVIVIIAQNGIIQYNSPNVTKQFGWAPDELIGKNAWDNVHPDDLEATQKFFGTNAGKTNTSGTTELRYKHQDGHYVWIEITVVNLLHDKDIQGYLGNFHDISVRKKAEQELTLAKEKAEESDRLKSAFLANMSHEIRTPMNGILGFTQLLKNTQLSGDKKEKYIELIEKSGNRMLNTINDIIDISKIEAGQVKVEKAEVSVNEILAEQYNFFYQQAKAKRLELNYKPCLTDSESRIITDPHKLEGILTNLLRNAIKFTETGEISFGYRLKDKANGKFIEFYVKDTGIGIPVNRVEAVFKRFEQADIKDTRVFEGSGLGLTISKSYVEMMGGEISVKSIEGEGSTFTFSIPYNRQ